MTEWITPSVHVGSLEMAGHAVGTLMVMGIQTTPSPLYVLVIHFKTTVFRYNCHFQLCPYCNVCGYFQDLCPSDYDPGNDPGACAMTEDPGFIILLSVQPLACWPSLHMFESTLISIWVLRI